MNRARLVVLAPAVVLASCIALPLPIPYKGEKWVDAPTDQAQPLNEPDKILKVGDSVRANLKSFDNKAYYFTVAEITDTGFVGINDHKLFHLSYDNISHLEVKRTGWKVFVITLSPQ